MEIGNIRPIDIDVEMRRSYLDYAMSVIVQRALPDVRDGLKPVQRRIMYGMYEMGLRSNTRFRKSAGVVGEVLKSYHPHSDTSVYDALVRMVQDFSLRYPLAQGQGNFGSVDGDDAAAMRYTESKLSAIAEELLIDIDKDTVDFKPNYDDQTREPTVLPARLPNLLINGASGIAVGMATNIPPHNLREVCDATTHLIDHPEATIEDLMQFIKGPDFPTGATILGREGIVAAYSQGRGRVVMRAVAETEEIRGNRWAIIVKELPFQVNKATLIEKIAEYVKAGRIEGIHDLRDESDRTGMRMVIELKRDAQPSKVLNNLFKHTALQSSFGVNMLALVDGTLPRTLTLKRVLELHIAHRQEILTRRTQYELDRARRRAHILEGLKIALDNLDAVIQTIRDSRSSESARNNLMRIFTLSELQAVAILDLQLRRLAALERRRIEDELSEVRKEIVRLEDILANPHKVLEMIKADLTHLRDTYGDDRRTRIIGNVSGELSDEDLIPNVEVLVTVTARGYVKRQNDDVYRVQRRGGRGVAGMKMRDEDRAVHLVAANSHDSLLFFTDRGRVYQTKTHEIPDSARLAKGMPIVNLLALMPDEQITTIFPVKDFTSNGYLFMCTRLGRVKRTSLDQFASVRSSGLIALSLDDTDELAWVRTTSGDDEIILVTEQAKAIRFHESDARSMGRTAAGVIGIRMAPNDRVVAVDVIDAGNIDQDLLVVATGGFGKRTSLSEFNRQGRGGQGVTAMKLSERNGKVAGAYIVNDESQVMFISSNGVVIRTSAGQISRYGRQTQGVAVMRLGKKDSVASLTIVSPGTDVEMELDQNHGGGNGVTPTT